LKASSYRVHPETGLIDYDQLEENAMFFKPAMVIVRICHPRDYDCFREIADANGAFAL
jgi:glycine hydroxymethyltransferase